MLSRKLFALTALFVLCLGLFAHVACTHIDPTADPVAVTAERSITTSFDAVNAFVQYDDQNRDLMMRQFPAIHAFAESLRKTAPDLFRDAWASERAYKQLRTQATGDKLNDALAKVQLIAAQARQYLIQVKSSS